MQYGYDSILASEWLTFAITGGQKGRDEGAALLAVRVDGVVSAIHYLLTHSTASLDDFQTSYCSKAMLFALQISGC